MNVYEQIAVLEEFLQRDFRERWAYELAVLYQRAGEEQRCISQCDEIVAYFGDGRFVIRALELKQSMTELTPQQEERLEILRSGGTIELPAPEPEESAQTGAEDADGSDGEDSDESGSDADRTEEAQEDASAGEEIEADTEEKTVSAVSDTEPLEDGESAKSGGAAAGGDGN